MSAVVGIWDLGVVPVVFFARTSFRGHALDGQGGNLTLTDCKLSPHVQNYIALPCTAHQPPPRHTGPEEAQSISLDNVTATVLYFN